MTMIDGGLSNGLIHRPRDTRGFSDPIPLVDLNWYIIDSPRIISDPISQSAFINDSWKEHILKQEKIIDRFETYTIVDEKVTPYDPGFRHPQLGNFFETIHVARRKLFKSLTNENENLMEIYCKHYLVWTKRLTSEEARVPIQLKLLALFFEDMLQKNFREQKFAITQEQRLASISTMTTQKDWIAVLLGCDCPLIVTHTGQMKHGGESRDMFITVGPAFVSEIIRGEALDKAKLEGMEKVRFLFF